MRAILLLTVLSFSVVGLATAQAVAQATAEAELAQFAYAGSLEDVQRLVAAGTAVDAVDAESHTALMWAAFNGHSKVVGYLLEENAEVDAKDSNGRTALMYASSGPFQETVELLLKKGAEVNLAGTLESFTPLMTAAAEGQTEVVGVLLAHGADPSLEDKDGDTALSFARQNGHAAVVELLEHPPQ